MRRAATSGKSGVVRRRRDSSRSVVGEVGFGVDIRERLVRRPQANLLIRGVIADGGFQLVLRHEGSSRWARRGDLLGRPAPSRASDGDRGGFRRMAAAAAGGGVEERRQIRLHRQTHKQAVMRMNEMRNAAPAMLKAQPDM